MRNQSGQYRNAVASDESQNTDNCLILETHPTLPRIGTECSPCLGGDGSLSSVKAFNHGATKNTEISKRNPTSREMARRNSNPQNAIVT